MDVHPTKNVSIGIDPYPCDMRKETQRNHGLPFGIKKWFTPWPKWGVYWDFIRYQWWTTGGIMQDTW